LPCKKALGNLLRKAFLSEERKPWERKFPGFRQPLLKAVGKKALGKKVSRFSPAFAKGCGKESLFASQKEALGKPKLLIQF